MYREVLERDFGWLDDVVRAKRPKRIPAVFTHVLNQNAWAIRSPADDVSLP